MDLKPPEKTPSRKKKPKIKSKKPKNRLAAEITEPVVLKKETPTIIIKTPITIINFPKFSRI